MSPLQGLDAVSPSLDLYQNGHEGRLAKPGPLALVSQREQALELQATTCATLSEVAIPPRPGPGCPAQIRQAVAALSSKPAEPVCETNLDEQFVGLDSRLQFHGEIARGGMGVVLRGRDGHLRRDVAVKVLQERHRHKPQLVRRFVEEAQITSQLQHPGIVPVYDMGQLADGRPWFTMKLVKGHTLDQVLDNRTGQPGDSKDRSRLLRVFEQVCQAVAYAHARGVVHRDLKPANIMIGEFGEVQVMDWGLVKLLRRSGIASDNQAMSEELPIAEECSVGAVRDGLETGCEAHTGTEFGTILGTPAYMAPEQARGEVETLDERVDVFGLGGILCAILTGKPPFTGGDARQLAVRSAHGDLTDAHQRLDRCGADPKLIDLAKSCLAPKPEDRPCDAGQLAIELADCL